MTLATALTTAGRIGLLTVTCGLWLALLVPIPAAADSTQYGGFDWYGSVYPMLAVDNADGAGGKLSGGAILSAGFRANRWLSVEVGGEWAHRFRYDRGSGPKTCTGTGGASKRYNAWQITAGGRLYFTDSMIQPFLLGHGGLIQTRDSGGGRSCKSSGFVARLGGGVEVFVTNDIALSLLGAYVLPVTGGARDHDYISIGLGLTWY